MVDMVVDVDPVEFWGAQVAPIIELFSYCNTFIVFMLGLFIGISLARWWQVRSVHLHGLLKEVRSLVSLMACVLPDEEHAEVRQKVARYALLSYRLVFLCSRGQVGRPELERLEAECLLERDEPEMEGLLHAVAEVDAMMTKTPVSGGPPPYAWAKTVGALVGLETRRSSTSSMLRAFDSTGSASLTMNRDFQLAALPWLWVSAEIQKLFKKGCLAPPLMSALHRMSVGGQNSIDSVQMWLSVQLPFAYVQLIVMLAHGGVILAAVKCGIRTALAEGWLTVACEVPHTFVICSLYLGLLEITAAVADPFGDDIIDIPAAQLSKELWEGCSALEELGGLPIDLMNSFLDEDGED